MSRNYTMHSRTSEAVTRREIAEEFRKWNPRYGSPLIETYDFPPPMSVGSVQATVRFVLRGMSLEVACSSQYNYGDNLRCCFYAIHSMRMNEVRGIADTMQNAYAQLAAPKAHRDPYEVLGIRPDAPMAIVDAAYRALAKTTHSDVGGDDEEMKELNAALERIKEERNGQT